MFIWRFVAWIGIALLVSTFAHAQIGGVDVGFNPPAIMNGAVPGTVRALIVQSTGKVIIAGDFTSIGGTARGRIARLNTDGTLDMSFALGAGANGPINALAEYTSGSLIIGGEFTTVDGTSRNRIARLSSLGALDTSFNPGTGTNGVVNAVLIATSYVYLGGDFTQVAGSTRNRFARLQSNGMLDPFFATGSGANAAVHCMVSDGNSSGDIYVGGAFTTFSGQSRNRLAAISSVSSGEASAFNVSGGPDGPVYCMSLVSIPSLTVLTLMIGGDFNSVGGVPRPRLASIRPSPGSPLIPTTHMNQGVDGPVRVLQFTPGNVVSGRLLIGGDFLSVNEIGRVRFARFTGTSSSPLEPLSWSVDATYGAPPGANAPVLAAGTTSEGKLVLAGSFGSIGGIVTQRVTRLYGDAGSQPPSTPFATAYVGSSTQIYLSWSSVSFATGYKIERSPDGTNGWTLLGSGSSPFIDSGLTPGTPYFYRVRATNSNGDSNPSAVTSATTLASDWTGAGSVDPAIGASAGTDGTVSAVVFQTDGRLVIGGTFSTVHGVARKNIARLLPDWSVDPSFDPGTGPDSTVTALALQNDGRIVIAGSFTKVATVNRKYVARLMAGGALDPNFDPGVGPNLSAQALAVQSDGRILLGGRFSTFNGSSRDGLVRLNSDGTIDDTFNASLNGIVYGIGLQRDGRIISGGSFTEINGVTGNGLGRLLSNGTIDSSFPIGYSGAYPVYALVALNNGRILIGGGFIYVNGTFVDYVARLNSDGSLDATFSQSSAPDSSVRALAAQSDGKVLIGGDFTKLGSNLRPRVARLNMDGSLDDTFRPGIGANATVSTLTVADDTSIIVGGSFSKFAEVTRGGLVRLKGDGWSVSPATPAAPIVTALSSLSLIISWNDLPNEQVWKLERSPDGVSGWEEIATLSYDVTNFTDTSLSAGEQAFYRLRAANGAGASDYSPAASGTTLTSYQQWKIDHAFALNASDQSDDDGDGVALIMEYGLGLDPAIASTNGLPVAQVFNGVLALTYHRARTDMLYSVESSLDLQTWTTSDVNQGGGSNPIAWSLIGPAPQKFLRLNVTLP